MAKLGNIALDFGISGIKLIQIGGKASAPKIEKLDSEPILSSVTDTAENFPKEAVSAALKTLLGRNKLSKIKKVAMTIPGQAAIVRTLQIPVSDPDRIAQMVRYEAEPLIPFPLADCAFGYKVLQSVAISDWDDDGNTAAGDEKEAPAAEGSEGQPEEETIAVGTTDVLVVAVKNERIRDYVDVLQEFKITPELIEIAPFSSSLAYSSIYPTQDEAVAIIDLGAGTTDISIIRNGDLEFTRAATVAGTTFSQGIESKLEVSFPEAEQMKIQQTHLSSEPPRRAQRGQGPGGRPGGPPGIPGAPGGIPPAAGPAGPKPPGVPGGPPASGLMGAKVPADG
ncbi:MAG: pilus assembly protein PilM, partial [Candidatus Lindowbacteria bacterium]|nr:pilus assembly protein PilM [Candidatus Lindowbacteria bacterium]